MNGARTIASGEATGNRELAVDWFWTLLSFVVALTMFATGGLGPAEHDQRTLDGIGVLIAAGISFPLLARRRATVAAFVAVMAAMVALMAFRYPPDVAVGPAVALFTLARASGRDVSARFAPLLAVAAFAAVATAVSLAYSEFLFPEIPFIGLVWLAIWFGGRAARLREEKMDSLEERAERAEREVVRERRLAAAEERSQIARDLHDTAGHAINVILVEAGAARLLRDRDPDRAEQALETIEKVAREQITEIDRLVHALRATDDGDPNPEACIGPPGIPKGPAAGDELFERMRAAGLDLDVEWVGRRRLGPRVGIASFRILQEALTNAARHGTGSASVRIKYREDDVEFLVENPVGGGAVNEGGFGLTGMRERAGIAGGTLEAGSENGTFRVRALLPYDPEFHPRTEAEETPEGGRPDERQRASNGGQRARS